MTEVTVDFVGLRQLTCQCRVDGSIKLHRPGLASAPSRSPRLPHFDCEDGGSRRRLANNYELPSGHRERVLGLNALEFFGL
jgi:hypothetical protein